jgi:hypothetical protein
MPAPTRRSDTPGVTTNAEYPHPGTVPTLLTRCGTRHDVVPGCPWTPRRGGAEHGCSLAPRVGWHGLRGLTVSPPPACKCVSCPEGAARRPTWSPLSDGGRWQAITLVACYPVGPLGQCVMTLGTRWLDSPGPGPLFLRACRHTSLAPDDCSRAVTEDYVSCRRAGLLGSSSKFGTSSLAAAGPTRCSRPALSGADRAAGRLLQSAHGEAERRSLLRPGLAWRAGCCCRSGTAYLFSVPRRSSCMGWR